MINEEVVAGMVKAIIKINSTLYPFSMIIPITLGFLFIIGFILSYKKDLTSYFYILIGCCYFYAGFPLLFTSEQLGNKAYLGGGVLLLFSLMFFLLLLAKRYRIVHANNKLLKFIGISLILCGIIFYPFIEYVTGFSWPGIAVFGMECPTTIAVIGLLIFNFGSSSKLILLILCINASFTGTSVAMNGALFDWSYAIAGYIGLIVLFIDIREPLKTII